MVHRLQPAPGNLIAQRILAVRLNPWIAIHCSGAQPLGLSHCSPLSYSVAMIRRGQQAARTASARRSACSWVAMPTYSGTMLAAENSASCSRRQS
jgi:hypothetical protein